MRRVEEIPIENDLWRKAVDEFCRAFTDEDKSFKKYSATLKTAPHSHRAGRFVFEKKSWGRGNKSGRDALLWRKCFFG